MREGRYVGVVHQAGFAEEEVGYSLGCGRGEHRAYVYRHVEKAESRIPLGCEFRTVIEVPDHHLEVAFEKPCPGSYQGQGPEHGDLAHCVCLCRDGKAQVPDEHDGETDGDAFAVPYLVSQYTPDKRHEIYCRKKASVYLCGLRGGKTEFCLYEQDENRQHGVVSEPFTGVGES